MVARRSAFVGGVGMVEETGDESDSEGASEGGGEAAVCGT